MVITASAVDVGPLATVVTPLLAALRLVLGLGVLLRPPLIQTGKVLALGRSPRHALRHRLLAVRVLVLPVAFVFGRTTPVVLAALHLRRPVLASDVVAVGGHQLGARLGRLLGHVEPVVGPLVATRGLLGRRLDRQRRGGTAHILRALRGRFFCGLLGRGFGKPEKGET